MAVTMEVNLKGILINNNSHLKILQKKYYNPQEVNRKYKIKIKAVGIAMSCKIIYNKNLIKIKKMNKIK